MPTFHPFPRLPTELRLEIWNAAIRPREPSAQFFTFSIEYKHTEYSLFTGEDELSFLSAPRRAPFTRRPSWTEFNPSAYLLDRGLWTANKESREVVEKHYRPRNANGDLAAFDPDWWAKSERQSNSPPKFLSKEAPATAMFKANGEEQYIVFHPFQDLLVLEPPSNSLNNWSQLIDSSLFFLSSQDSQTTINVALEFDATLCMEMRSHFWHGREEFQRVAREKDFFKSAIGFATDHYLRATRWLIDKSMRLTPDAKTLPRKRDCNQEKWRLGDGRQLVQVMQHDQGWTHSEVWRFIDMLDHEAEELDGWPCVIGVLAFLDETSL